MPVERKLILSHQHYEVASLVPFFATFASPVVVLSPIRCSVDNE